MQKVYVVLYGGIVIYSLASVCSKTAAGYPLLSMKWIFFYGLGILAMSVYALIWQQVLKHLPLTTAYANRASVTILGLIWGVLFFGENVSPKIIIGAVIIMIGVIIVTGAENEK